MDRRAGWGRRILALAVDWAACTLVSVAFFGDDPWATLLVFVAEQAVLVGLAGAGFGHVLTRIQVRRLDGTMPGLVRATGRALLLAVVIPAVVTDSSGRGLHDRLVGTVLRRAEGRPGPGEPQGS